jgi:hypothetical protein
MRFWTELAFIMTTTSQWRKWCRRFRTSREGVSAVSAETDGEEEEVVEETLRRRAGTLEPVKPPQRRLRLWSFNSSAPLGHRTNPVGSDSSVPMERQFYSTTRKCFGCNRFGHTARRQTINKFLSGTRWRETGRDVPQAGAVRPGPNWRW